MSHFHNNMLLGSAGNQGAYEIERSLRFHDGDSTYLNRTFSTPTDNIKWTWSGWVKRATLGAVQNFFIGDDGSSNNFCAFRFLSTDEIDCAQISGGTYNLRVKTNAVFRDVSAWYHIVLVYDSANATSTDRIQIYVNGDRQDVTYTTGPVGPSTACQANVNARPHAIGRILYVNLQYLDAYLAEVNFIDGQAHAPTSFGKTDTTTGAWIPKEYTGSYGNNGFFLSFSDNSSPSALGTDSSPNGNNWTPNNFSVTAGVDNDSMEDTPTNNYATLNPLDKTGGTMAQGNLTYTGVYSDVVTRNGHGARSTLKVPSSGKWYVEVSSAITSGIGNACYLVFTSSEQRLNDATGFSGTLTPFIGVDASGYNNRIYLQWVGVSGGTANSTVLFSSYAYGDIVNLAIDFDNGKFWVGHNGTWYNSGDPAAGTNATSTFTAGTEPWGFWAEYVASSDNSNRSQARVNFGQQGFEYTQPSGFLAMSSANLPVPTIKDGTDYFTPVLYESDNTAQSITVADSQGNSWAPDWVWIKGRNYASNSRFCDTVRGAGVSLKLATAAAGTDPDDTNSANRINAFTSSGFDLNAAAAGDVNQNTQTYVAWNWKAGGNSNTFNVDGTGYATASAAGLDGGTITPTGASVNTAAGISIIAYTGDGVDPNSSTVTVSHGLNASPAMIITKKRSSGTTDYGWSTWHQDLNAGSGFWFHLNNAQNAAMWDGYANNSSTLFSPADKDYNNELSETYINYIFAEVEGFSKFGSYDSNNSSDGPYIYTGFRPAFVICKDIDRSAMSYIQHDTARSPYNPATNSMNVHGSGTEPYDTASPIDILSNGFKLRAGSASYNNSFSGDTFMYMAFAETPFKYANAR